MKGYEWVKVNNDKYNLMINRERVATIERSLPHHDKWDIYTRAANRFEYQVDCIDIKQVKKKVLVFIIEQYNKKIKEYQDIVERLQ